MCGIVSIVGTRPVNQSLYDALMVLQHRGQDAAGIVTCEGNKLHLRKDNGLARDVFETSHMLKLRGNMGIGHVRYPTAGCFSSAEAQPFYVNSPYGVTLAHNGNLTNAHELKQNIYKSDLRHINTESDSEILLNVFAHELQVEGKLSIDADDIFKAVENVHRRCRGGYAAVAMIPGFCIIGFRDPYGIRPVCFGKRKIKQDTEYMIASESVALDTAGFIRIRDLEPGEAIVITNDGKLSSKQCAINPIYSPCIFEFVYFARPDSIIDDIFVYKARQRMGQRLAAKIKREWPSSSNNIDVVIPIPDTSRTAALALSEKLKIPYTEGFIKNRYIGRTFIMPGQQVRKKSVHQKLNAIDLEFKGRNVLLVDDSIVRGTTSRQIVQMARDVGAKKVYFASAAPPVRYPNVYGIDMPTARELIAHGRSEELVCKHIGADRLIYQDLKDLIAAVQKKKRSKIKKFDTSIFSGQYVTGDINDLYLKSLELARNDITKNKKQEEENNQSSDNAIDLYNQD